MTEYKGENRLVLRGELMAPPVLSHQNHGVDYYTAPLRVPRLSGSDDELNLITVQPAPAVNVLQYLADGFHGIPPKSLRMKPLRSQLYYHRGKTLSRAEE